MVLFNRSTLTLMLVASCDAHRGYTPSPRTAAAAFVGPTSSPPAATRARTSSTARQVRGYQMRRVPFRFRTRWGFRGRDGHPPHHSHAATALSRYRFAETPKHLQDKERFRKLTDFDDQNDRVVSRGACASWVLAQGGRRSCCDPCGATRRRAAVWNARAHPSPSTPPPDLSRALTFHSPFRLSSTGHRRRPASPPPPRAAPVST